jgi:glycosyltransferase involved in cell wall biosynthesis
LETHNAGGRGDEELRHLVDRADALVSLSEAGVGAIRDRWPEAAKKPIIVIPLGHFAGWYRTDIRKSEARAVLGLPVDARIGAMVGRLQPYKGLEDMVPAFGVAAGPKDWLVIAGAPTSAAYAARLGKLTAGYTRVKYFPGWISKPTLETILCASDYGVFPFREIFNSASVMLALSFGLPVVATRRGAIPEVVPDYAWFDAGDGSQASLGTALRRAMESKNLAEAGRRVREHVLRVHSWAVVGRRLRTLYETLAQNGV